MKHPTSTEEVGRFLGMVTYYFPQSFNPHSASATTLVKNASSTERGNAAKPSINTKVITTLNVTYETFREETQKDRNLSKLLRELLQDSKEDSEFTISNNIFFRGSRFVASATIRSLKNFITRTSDRQK
ncbi:hypothetical protein J6590_056698 [Homalodisca vitripennis]|nr:hypothetical protein J6590_056698 [Homalodisca vitripennis]